MSNNRSYEETSTYTYRRDRDYSWCLQPCPSGGLGDVHQKTFCYEKEGAEREWPLPGLSKAESGSDKVTCL